MLTSLFLFLLSSSPALAELSSPETRNELTEVSKALEFQYEQKLEKLKVENQQLKSELDSLKKKPSLSCKPASKDLILDTQDLQKSKDNSEAKEIYLQGIRAFQAEKWDEALLRLEHFVRYFHESKLADNAVFWMAKIYIEKSQPALAQEELQRLLRDYPKSERASLAKTLLNKIESGGHP